MIFLTFLCRGTFKINLKEETMYKISQFSIISGLTVKALRYYDETDILKPSFRNEENQYRYYNDSDLKKSTAY